MEKETTEELLQKIREEENKKLEKFSKEEFLEYISQINEEAKTLADKLNIKIESINEE